MAAAAIFTAVATTVFIVPATARRSLLGCLGSGTGFNFKPVCSLHALRIGASTGPPSPATQA